MDQRPIHSGLKLALELGPIAAFFLAYLLLRGESVSIAGRAYDGFVVATAGFVPLLLLATWLTWRLSGRLSRMQVATAVLVVVFGGLTVALNDERFFKMKPTLVYAFFAGALGLGLLRGRSLLHWVLDGMMPLTRTGWMILTRRLALFFALLALANEVVWRTMSTDAWVSFKTFALPCALFAFFLAQGGLLRRHGRGAEGAEGGEDRAGGP